MKQVGCVVSHQTIIDVYGYWDGLRGAADAPLKSQIQPSTLGQMLTSLFILEIAGDGIVTFRLAGSRICDLFGHDLRDESFSDLFGDDHAGDIESTLIGAMRHAIPALINATGYSTAGHQASFEIIVMPLRSEDGSCERLLGAIAPSAAASWLEVVPLDFFALDRCRVLRALQDDKAGDRRLPYLSADVRPHGFGALIGRMVSSLLSGAAHR
jgi:hypothetical protein